MGLAIGNGIGIPYSAGVLSYVAKVLGIAPANLIGYWPLSEESGAVADNAEGTAARDGAYTGVTLADDETGGFGTPAPLFDGANDYVDIGSASLESVFDGAEGTMAVWLRVSGAGVWTDGLERSFISLLVNSSNYFLFRKSTSDDSMQIFYRAGAVSKFANVDSGGNTGWLHVAMTWSAAADEVKVYQDGNQEGSTLTGLGTWSPGAFSRSYIGAETGGPGEVWDGWLAHAAIWDTPLSAAQIAELAAV